VGNRRRDRGPAVEIVSNAVHLADEIVDLDAFPSHN
jgi:hypothetical protein